MLGADRNATRGRSPADSRIHLFVRRSLAQERLLRLFDHAESNTACFQAFLQALARKFARQDILLVLDGAPNHRCGDLAVPDNITLLYLPPYSPELNPKENLGTKSARIFKNYALKIHRRCARQAKQAILSSQPELPATAMAARERGRFPADLRLGIMTWEWDASISETQMQSISDADQAHTNSTSE